MGKSACSLFLIILSTWLVGCGQTNLSDRDSKREQLKSSAEVKRRELKLVAGEYRGRLTQTSGVEQMVVLKLEIKDIPTAVEGQVDPVPTPVLTGFMRFYFGLNESASEFIGFGVQKADFDPINGKLDLVVENSDYKQVILSLEKSGAALNGNWTAPGLSTSGSAQLNTNTAPTASLPIKGEYAGSFVREGESSYQFAHLTIATNVQPPEGLQVSATLRLICGDWNSTEYLTYRFDSVQFNPISGQIVFRSTPSEIILSGYWSNGQIVGDWSTTFTGRMGKVDLKRALSPETPSIGSLFKPLRGTYQGTLRNTHPQSNLPERVMASFVTSQDLTLPNGIRITGNLRFYFGAFGSNEYFELPFTDIQYNFYTRKLVAKTGGDYKMTFKGDVTLSGIVGNLFTDALGEVAAMEVAKP